MDSAELQALVKGLNISWERRTAKVIVVIDSENVFNWVTSHVETSHEFFKLIYEFTWLRCRPWDFNIELIRRSVNNWADALAKMRHNHNELLILDDPSQENVMFSL